MTAFDVLNRGDSAMRPRSARRQANQRSPFHRRGLETWIQCVENDNGRPSFPPETRRM